MSSPVKLKKISPSPKKNAKVDRFSIGPSPLRNSSFDYRKPTLDHADFMQNDLFDVQQDIESQEQNAASFIKLEPISPSKRVGGRASLLNKKEKVKESLLTSVLGPKKQ